MSDFEIKRIIALRLALSIIANIFITSILVIIGLYLLCDLNHVPITWSRIIGCIVVYLLGVFDGMLIVLKIIKFMDF